MEVFDDGFEDFSVNTEQERLTSDIERATEQWLLQLNLNERLHGQERVYEGATHTTAVEGAHDDVLGTQLHCTACLADPPFQPFVSAVIKHDLPFREEPYVLKLHVPQSAQALDGENTATVHFCDHRGFAARLHNVERLFGVGLFMSVRTCRAEASSRPCLMLFGIQLDRNC